MPEFEIAQLYLRFRREMQNQPPFLLLLVTFLVVAVLLTNPVCGALRDLLPFVQFKKREIN